MQLPLAFHLQRARRRKVSSGFCHCHDQGHRITRKRCQSGKARRGPELDGTVSIAIGVGKGPVAVIADAIGSVSIEAEQADGQARCMIPSHCDIHSSSSSEREAERFWPFCVWLEGMRRQRTRYLANAVREGLLGSWRAGGTDLYMLAGLLPASVEDRSCTTVSLSTLARRPDRLASSSQGVRKRESVSRLGAMQRAGVG
ncbi:hypothetical protein NA57DRAFT_56720 [Rhizodiscina lignyota]|uniref:Uncharacterized protein n=1 Tax=Rhizodiscina lignyota TaxID=1504668 RepID=A0A9P4ICM3_9PEZI|nr:hypothetical protein NA57DRAFT_56720 [Rhizodiscina lignyota]